MVLIFLILGFVFLIAGAEALVRGASKLATTLGVPSLVIGLTVVAYGTSAPELAVSVFSSYQEQADIAMGNIVGSNIFNILFILGLSALIAPLVVSRQLIRLDVPLMIGVSLLTLGLGADGKISHWDGILLFSGALIYTFFLIYQGRKEGIEFSQQPDEPEIGKKPSVQQTTSSQKWMINIGLIAAGLILLVLGSRWLITGATAIATHLGISELIIGLTIIAVGTSLPEVATSVIASLRGERDIAVGNVVGSNMFNILFVLGLSGIVAPEGVQVSQAVLHFDMPIMIAVAIACLPVFFTGNLIARWEGGVFLGYYVAYMLYIVLAATHHTSLPVFSKAMLYFVIPITVLTLIIVTVQAVRAKKTEKKQYQ
jgi:cation:H+ antiporter